MTSARAPIRDPLMDEIRQLYLLAFYGKDTKEAAKI